MAKRSYNNSAGRRPHGEKPYDANNSFVKKMATKMTDLIPQRSWISKWFNSPGSNGDLSNEDTENPDEQEVEETLIQPPAKRPRIRMDVTHPPGTFAIQPRSRNPKDQYPIRDDTVDFLESEAPGPSGSRSFVSSTPAIRLEMRNSNSLQTDLVRQQNNGAANGTDENSESGESTSGCSSLIPQTRQENLGSQFHRKGLAGDKLTYTNHLQSARSLFIDSISGGRESMSSRRPSFNASIVNNDGNPLERSVNILSSPFYSGNIAFGGANAVGTSAMRQNRRNLAGASDFQLRVPRRSSIQVKPSNVPGVDSSGMSQTAKRILEALEHFSSPISDAKKIPLKASGPNSVTKKRGRDESFDLPPISRVGLRHLTRELAVPTVPDMLKLKRRQRLQDTTLAARRIITANSEPPPQPPTSSTATTPESSEYHLRSENDSQKFFGKLRAKSKKKPDIEQPAEVVNLPSIPLPITSLPSFDIPLPKPSTSTITTTATIESKPSSLSPRKTFKFSSPIKLQNDSTSPIKSVNHFTFSKPLSPNSNDRHQDQTLKTLSNVSNSVTFNFGSNQTQPATNFVWTGSSTAPRPKEIKQTEKKKKDEDEELKTGSVMDILGSNLKKTEADIWECSECFIKNNQTDEHCVACKVPKKRDTSAKISTTSTNILPLGTNDNQFGAQFKMSSDKWECQCCLVRNPVSETKCVSCMTPKQDKKLEPTPVNPPVVKSSSSYLMDKFKPAKDSWECPGCMLRNPSGVISCPCCNASKPGLLKTPAPKKSEEKPALLPTTNTSKTWKCPSCMVRNNLSTATCVCCTTPNPQGSSKPTTTSPPNTLTTASGFGDKFKIPAGAWSCDTCMVQNKADVTECVACGGVKPGAASKPKADDKNDSAPKFSFGIPSSTAATFTFGIPSTAKPEEKTKTETPTNGFTFGVPASQVSDAAAKFSFGMPKTTQPETTKAKEFPFAAPTTVTPFKAPEQKKPEASTLFNNISETKVGFSFSNPTEIKTDTPKEQSTTPAPQKTEGAKPITFGAPPVQPAETSQNTSATTALTPTPSLFTFSEPKSSTTQPTPVLTFGQSTVPMGQTINTSNSSDTPKPTEGTSSEPPTKKPTMSFGKPAPTPSVFGENTEAKPVLAFGPPTVNNTEKPAFPVENKLPSFGTIDAKTPVFGNTADKPMFNTPTPTFAVPAAATTTAAPATPAAPASIFGSSSGSSIFASGAPIIGTPNSSSSTPSIFSSVKPTEPPAPANPGVFTFGASPAAQGATQPTTGGFNFSTGSSATPAAIPKPVFGFGTNQTTPQPAASFGGFGNPTPTINPAPTLAFSFNAPKSDAPPAFGQTPAAPISNIFGNSQPSTASSFGTLNSASTSGGFNFGAPSPAPSTITPSTASTSGGFNFAAAAPTAGFNFNAPTQPSFNFTGGNAPTAFNATPQATTPTTRKIKKAVRRMPPRT